MAKSIIEKIEFISNNIRNKIPRLMELNFGCKVITKECPNKIITIGHNCYDISVDKVIIDEMSPVDSKNKYQYINKIIGKEPMLNDVLQWFYLLNGDYSLNISEINNYINIWFNNKSIDIDLNKPYLKDWNENIINFLFEICQNQ